MNLEDLVREKRVLVCVGSGGVGKTTTAAAIALEAAKYGKRACVLTIDPAKRLANAMGIDAIGNVPTRVEDAKFDSAGIGRPAGQLWAMMLDPKRTWDDLVMRFAPSPEQAQRILANNYYQQISSALAGSQEFMAMEKLYQLHESGKYDLVVLDTPPTRHAIDFLDAPAKMMGFMDERVLQVFLAPSKIAGKLGLGMFQSSFLMLKSLQTITGFDALREIADFIESLSGMHAGFRDRARTVEELLRGDTSTFLLVTSPNPPAIDEAKYFFFKLAEYRMPFGGFVMNRVHADVLTEPGAKDSWLRLAANPAEILEKLNLPADSDLASRLVDNFTRAAARGEVDASQISRLRAACPGPYLWRSVPAFDTDIHDLSGLSSVGAFLFQAW
jgi:anion-transporting  ArsA/GET3 family ATPase